VVVSIRALTNRSGRSSAVFLVDAIIVGMLLLSSSMMQRIGDTSLARLPQLDSLFLLSSVLFLALGWLGGFYHAPAARTLTQDFLVIARTSLLVIGCIAGLLAVSHLWKDISALNAGILIGMLGTIGSVLLGVRWWRYGVQPQAYHSVPTYPRRISTKPRAPTLASPTAPSVSAAAPPDVSLRAQIEGKRVLVVGADTMYGRALSYAIAAHAPAALILQGQHERGVAETYDALHVLLAPEQRPLLRACTADLRMADRLDVLIRSYQPDLLIHAGVPASAPLLEHDPVDLAASVVLGTRHLLHAAAEVAQTIVVMPLAAPNQQPVLAACQRFVALQVAHICPQPLVAPTAAAPTLATDAPTGNWIQIAQHILQAALNRSPALTLVTLASPAPASSDPLVLPSQTPEDVELLLDELAQVVHHGDPERVVQILQQCAPKQPRVSVQV